MVLLVNNGKLSLDFSEVAVTGVLKSLKSPLPNIISSLSFIPGTFIFNGSVGSPERTSHFIEYKTVVLYRLHYCIEYKTVVLHRLHYCEIVFSDEEQALVQPGGNTALCLALEGLR